MKFMPTLNKESRYMLKSQKFMQYIGPRASGKVSLSYTHIWCFMIYYKPITRKWQLWQGGRGPMCNRDMVKIVTQEGGHSHHAVEGY